MKAMAFDTHRAVKSLIGQGVPAAQTEVFVDVISNSRSFDASELATKLLCTA